MSARTRLAALFAAIVMVVGLHRSAAQIQVPPGASLDVPAAPMPVRIGGRLHLVYERSEGMPYVFKRFDVLGAFRSLDAFAKGEPWVPSASERRLELPGEQTVVRF